jgi:hypothetical protein
VTPWKFHVEGESGSEADDHGGAGPEWGSDRSDGEGEPRRFTLDYKRRIVREADGCKTSGAVGALPLDDPFDSSC